MAETEIRCLHCGHTEDEHYHSWADCSHEDCICVMFERVRSYPQQRAPICITVPCIDINEVRL